MVKIVEKELIDFIKKLKKGTDISMDKHLLDHLLWIVKEYYK